MQNFTMSFNKHYKIIIIINALKSCFGLYIQYKVFK